MTHLYNIKNSDKTNEAHSQYCSNMRDYTIRSLWLNASHKLFSGCFHRLLRHMLLGDGAHARKKLARGCTCPQRVARGCSWSHHLTVPTPTHTHAPTAEGPCYTPPVAVFGHRGGGSATLATQSRAKAGISG